MSSAIAQSDSTLMLKYEQYVQDYFGYYDRGQADSAEIALRAALLTLPDYEGNFLLEANLAELVVSRGDTLDALGLLTSVLNSQPDLDEVRSRRSELLSKSSRYEDALADLGVLIERHPMSEVYRYRRALILRETGLLDDAVADLRKILEQNPDAYIPRVTLAEILGEQGSTVQAEQIFARLIEDYPSEHMASRALAKHYLKQGQKAQALETMRKAINSGKRVTADEYLIRGLVWLAYGEEQESKRDFGKAKELGATDEKIYEAKRWLQELKQR